MDLKILTTPTTLKPGTDIWCASLHTDNLSVTNITVTDIVADSLESDVLILRDNLSVPNPPVGSVSFYSDGKDFKSTDPSGNEAIFLTTATPDIYASQDEINALLNQTQSIAPAGMRDLWAPSVGAVALSSYIHYASDFGLLYSAGQISIASSSNGGATFTLCTYDIAPAGAPFVYVGSKPGLVVAVLSDHTTYTSTNGIHFIKGPNAPGESISFNIHYYAVADLLISGHQNGGTFGIMTTPDGLTWTNHFPSGLVYSIHSNNDICVATITASPFFIYSTDGLNWTPTPSTVTGCESFAWSEEQKIWLAINTAGLCYTSQDGITWTSIGTQSPPGLGNSLIWVGGVHQRWYLGWIDTNGNYSLVYTPDPLLTPFVATQLDGATVIAQQFNLQYISPTDNFALGLGTTPYIAYSTPRPRDIKAISDNIRVRNNPVSVSNYSVHGTPTITNTVVETTLSNTVSALGSLFFQDPQPTGMSIHIRHTILVTSNAGDTLTVRIKTQAVTLQTLIFIIPALSVSLPIDIDSMITLSSNGTSAGTSTKAVINGGATLVQFNTANWTRTIANTLNITGQFAAALSTAITTSLVLNTHFRNGA